MGHLTMTDNVGREQIKSFVERIERLNEEIASLSDDRKAVYAEAKFSGFDTKILRKVIARRKRDAAELAEEDAILSLYLGALGQLATTPLGKAAVGREF